MCSFPPSHTQFRGPFSTPELHSFSVLWYRGQHIWLAGANLLHALRLSFNPFFSHHSPNEQTVSKKDVQLFVLCVCVSTVYDDACQGDMRAKSSLYWWLMCFSGNPLHTLNPWERGPQSPGRSERKYGRSSCVHLFVCVGRVDGCAFVGMGSRFPEQRGTFSDTPYK